MAACTRSHALARAGRHGASGGVNRRTSGGTRSVDPEARCVWSCRSFVGSLVKMSVRCPPHLQIAYPHRYRTGPTAVGVYPLIHSTRTALDQA
eukprot:scaffold21446_cov52-Phaeocystis_antarctica.AAC.2